MKRSSFLLLTAIAACGGGSDDVASSDDASTDVDMSDGDADTDAVDASGAAEAEAAAETSPPDPCADAGIPPPTLACSGLYADFAKKIIAPRAMEYTPATPLWSDGAQKQRWIVLPANSKIDATDPNEWNFPVGTKLFKEFRVSGHRVETRMFQKVDVNFWNYATYAWNGDETNATIHYGGPVPTGDGGNWIIPTNDDCNECHRGRRDRILGFEQVSLGLPDAQGLTLARLVEMGLVAPAPARVSLTIGDDGTGLSPIALGWIHVNCGVTCHNSNPSAAGYGAAMILRLDPTQLNGAPPDSATWNILKTTLGVPCVSGSLIGQPRISVGDPTRSEIYQLIDERGPLQMPPIASRLIDTADVAVVASWIRAMATDAGAPSADAQPPNPGTDAGGDEVSQSDASTPEAGNDGGDAGTIDQADASSADEPDAGATGGDESTIDGGSEGPDDAPLPDSSQ